jgi:Uma2 family endonuclease
MTVASPVEVPGRVVMHGVSWAAYERLLDVLEQQHVRVTYEQGRLEIVSPTRLHERIKRLLSLLVSAISREFNIPIHGFGSATFKREGLERGIEADEWLYVENEAAVRGKDDVDLDVDPPPDLAIEVDVTSTINSRLPIYWALAIAEIWVWRDGVIRFLHRRPKGKYVEIKKSQAFPFLTSSVLTQFLNRRHQMDEIALVDALIKYLKSQTDKK